MTIFIKVVYWTGLCILIYSYVGYGVLLYLRKKIRSGNKRQTGVLKGELPPVTLIVAAFNEEDFIAEKIKNSLELDYPADKLKLIFVTDGSTDRTPALVAGHTGITHLHEAARKGKMAAMDRAITFVDTDLIVFSDANTLLNKASIMNIVRHYRDPMVGGVAGEKKIMQSAQDTIAAGEGLYWKYESFLKKMDSDFYTVVGAAGELFSIRKSLYEFPGDNILLDDFVISLRVCQKGYRVVYEPDAFAIETASASLKEEQKRKVRISAGAFQSMVLLKELLNIFKYPRLSFQYISHRVLRWTLCPLFLPLIFLANLYLFQQDGSFVYTVLMIAQIAFYTMALAGWVLSLKRIKIGVFYGAYYFIFINISLYLGFFRFLRGEQTVIWEKAGRKKYSRPNTVVY